MPKPSQQASKILLSLQAGCTAEGTRHKESEALMDIDEIYYEAIDLLKAMIATPRVSREEKEVANVVERRMRAWGLSPKRSGNNLWCMPPDFDPAKPTVLLNAHLDTVKPVEGWKRDPCTPVEEDGRLYGLGSNDDGASVVSLLAAHRMLTEHEQPCNFIFLASAEEEVSGKGGVEMMLPMLPAIDVALVGEPTGMNPAIAEKGLMVLDAVVHGVAGHAARNEGVNAIYLAVDVIDKLRHLAWQKVSPMLGPVKVTVTKIEAGQQHNIVPDVCKMLIDVRTTDAYTNAETLQLLREAVPGCELTPHSTRLNPSSIDASHPLVQRAMMLGKEPFGSPTLSDQALMPFPSMKMGPGQSSRSHTADEYIECDEVREAIDTYIVLLNGLHL